MGWYPTQSKIDLIGNSTTAATLTNAYTGNTKSFNTGGMEELILHVKYTTGSGETNNSIQIKLEFSPDESNYFQEVSSNTSAGTSTLTLQEYSLTGASAATSYSFRLPVPIAERFMKISVKESGVATNAGTAWVAGILSGK